MTNPTNDPRAVAVARHLSVDPESVSECRQSDNQYECESKPGEYLVLTDGEANEAFRVWVESYIEDMQSGWHPTAKQYFDSAAFIRDVELNDGRGPSLASYDSAEECETVDGVDYYIYRTV